MSRVKTDHTKSNLSRERVKYTNKKKSDIKNLNKWNKYLFLFSILY